MSPRVSSRLTLCVLAVGTLLWTPSVAQQRQLTNNISDSRYYPFWSPDGREIGSIDGDAGGLSIMDLDTRQERSLYSGNFGQHDWSPDGTRIAFRKYSGVPGVDQLYWITPLNGTWNPILATPGGGLSPPVWTPDGAGLVYQRNTGSGDLIYKARVSNGQETRLSTSRSDRFYPPTVDPLGEFATFVFAGSLIRVPLAGGGAEVILFPGGGLFPPMPWSPEGSALAMNVGPTPGTLRLYLIGRHGGSAAITPSGVVSPSWSPDGEWLAVNSSLQGISVLDLITGSTTPLGPGSPSAPLYVSPDGTEILYQAQDLRGIAQLFVVATRRAPVPAPVGTRRVGSQLALALRSPGDAGLQYVLAASFSKTPSIQVQGRPIPLAFDALFVASLVFPQVFEGFQGVLDAAARATATIRIPAAPALAGLRFYVAFVTFDGAGLLRTVGGARPIILFP